MLVIWFALCSLALLVLRQHQQHMHTECSAKASVVFASSGSTAVLAAEAGIVMHMPIAALAGAARKGPNTNRSLAYCDTATPVPVILRRAQPSPSPSIRWIVLSVP